MYSFNRYRNTKEKIFSFIKREHFLVLGILLVIVIAFVSVFFLPPQTFEIDSYVEVEKGTTMSAFAKQLKEEGYIKSVFLFQTLAIAFGGDGGLVAGDYAMDKPQSIPHLARRFTSGIYDLERIRVRLFEGDSVYDYAEVLDSLLPRFDKVQFLRIAEEKEGYLFPDTYIFFETADEQDVIAELEETFEEKTKNIRARTENSKRSFEDIITMASIIEKEATNDTSEQQIIAGILWKRLDKGMLLQVDAPFKYYLDKGSFDLSIDDLRTDHSYNTYTRKGLTPTPIGNPGISAMLAALDPTPTSYYFYLHGRDGVARYAVTHDGHVENKRLYLR
jgi:UPF0755 protein